MVLVDSLPDRCLLSVWKIPDRSERRAWIWLWVIAWVWIVVSSYRAGGDQWDNPRYRVIFLLWQALLAAYTWECGAGRITSGRDAFLNCGKGVPC